MTNIRVSCYNQTRRSRRSLDLPVRSIIEATAISFTYANSFHYLGKLMPYLVAIVKKKFIGF